MDPRAGGTNRLLRQGATLVTSAADVIEVLTPILGRPELPSPVREPSPGDAQSEPPGADDALRERIANLLSPTPIAIDDLARAAQAPAGAVQIVLLELELAGRLERHGGGMVSLL
jgi:DNA processing protein